MENIVNHFNQALGYIHHEQFEEALEMLEKIKHSNHSQVNWALGLVYVMIGFPKKAMFYWNEISEHKIPAISTSKSSVEQKIPLYEELYETYNRALTLLKENKFIDAYEQFQELLSYKEEVPLPVDFYQGFLLLKIVNGEKEAALQELQTFPEYVKNHSIIREIEDKLDHLSHETLDDRPKNNRKIKKMIYGFGLAASIMIGALSIKDFVEGEAQETTSEPPVTVAETNKYKEKFGELEGTVNELKVQQEQLKTDLKSKEMELKDQSKVQNLLSIANVDLELLASKTGLTTYQKGVQAYKDGLYKDAVTYFEQSKSVESDEYFSDDALFYLIQAKRKLGETDNLIKFYDEFLLSKGSHFQSSPYYDDVLLGKVVMLIASGDKHEAATLLEKIQQDYQNEWTALRAKEIVEEITEGNDANS